MLFITKCENHQPPRSMFTNQSLIARIAVGLRIMADLVAALKSFVKCTLRNRLQRFSTIKAEGSPSWLSSLSSLSSEYSFEWDLIAPEGLSCAVPVPVDILSCSCLARDLWQARSWELRSIERVDLSRPSFDPIHLRCLTRDSVASESTSFELEVRPSFKSCVLRRHSWVSARAALGFGRTKDLISFRDFFERSGGVDFSVSEVSSILLFREEERRQEAPADMYILWLQ